MATGIVMGLLLSGPMMFLSSILFEQSESNLEQSLKEVMQLLSYVGAACLMILVSVLTVAHRYFTQSPLNLVAAYIASAGFYLATLVMLIEECHTINADSRGTASELQVQMFAFAQNLCRSFMLAMLAWSVRHRTGRPEKARSLVLGAVGLALVFAAAPPNTLNEMCPSRSGVDLLWATNLVVYFYFFATLYLLFRLAGRDGQVADEGADEGAVHTTSQRSQKSGETLYSFSSALAADITTTGIVLGTWTLLRLFMEALMGTVIQVAGTQVTETAAFLQMLVIEHVLEHSQVPFMLVVFFLSPDLAAVGQRLCGRRRGRIHTGDSDGGSFSGMMCPTEMLRQALVSPAAEVKGSGVRMAASAPLGDEPSVEMVDGRSLRTQGSATHGALPSALRTSASSPASLPGQRTVTLSSESQNTEA
jgi:NADH:ubiquinone oxidoreductase subunit 6 (subunit J)